MPSGVRIGLQRRSDGNRRIETRDQRALSGMVQVGLAWPDGADDLVVLVQLVEPGTILVVDQVFVDVLPEDCILVLVPLLADDGGQRGGGVHGFGESPMHTVSDDGLAVPISGVGQANGAFGVPCIGKCLGEQVLGCLDKLLLAFFGTLLGAQRKLGDETSPFNAMAWGCSVRLELVVRLVMVAFEVRLPVGSEMLWNAPAVVGCPSDHMVDDT